MLRSPWLFRICNHAVLPLLRCGTTAPRVWYYRTWHNTRYYRCLKSLLWHFSRAKSICFSCFAVVFALILLAFCACLFCGVCLGGGSGAPAHRSNPSRDMGSKHMRNTEVAEGSNAPQRRTKTSATKEKEPAKGMDEIPLDEFIAQRKINPYGNPRANF